MDPLDGAVLVVEDDSAIRRGLRTTLGAMRFTVAEATSGEDALAQLRGASFDAVLMDLNMPGMGGLEACRRIRREYPQIALLVVTVREDEEDTITALDAGADDYVTKPFQIRELAARLRAAIRRGRVPPAPSEVALRVGVFELDPGRRWVKKAGQEVKLTPTEFDLLHLLMKHAGHPLTHAKLLSGVWGAEYREEREYLRTFILQLRRKIEDDPAQRNYLQTVNYLGYRFYDPAAE
jgi:two-component system KDP operon response regulator KdpE